jgi:lactate permease
MMTRFFGDRKSWTEGLAILPFTLFGGLAFTVPYLITGWLLGPEFPSLFGAAVGLALVTFAARRRWLTPADHWEFPDRRAAPDLRPVERGPLIGTVRAWAPYGIVAGLLVLTRLRQLPVGRWLRAVRLEWTEIFGTGVSAATTPLYLPATILLIAVAVTWHLHRMPRAAILHAIHDARRTILGAGFVLVFTVPMVRVYINSGTNAALAMDGSTLPSMPIAMASWVATNVGEVWPLFAPAIGALGAFIAGSNTVSNLMFSLFQFGVATQLGISAAMVVALQAVGAAAGNMIAIHNVVAASATVGLLDQEGATLRRTILPTLYYLAVVGALGALAVYALDLSPL